MNVENINLVIEAIRSQQVAGKPVRLEMEKWVSPLEGCGTAACISGFCHLLMGKHALDAHHSRESAEWLDLNWDDAEELFIAYGYELKDITPEQAIKTLEILRDTGTVDWSHIENTY